MKRTGSEIFALLHVLSRGSCGAFSDWSATTSFFDNCMGLGLHEDENSETNVDIGSSPAVGKWNLKAVSQLVIIALKLVGI